MSLMRIMDLFNFEKGVLQSSKCTSGEFDFITAASEWKNHNEFTHDCEALVFAAAASGSLGRTHYVNGKFISSDLCFIITAKDPKNFPIDLKFYHMIFNEFKNDIVNNTKAGTSKEAIGMKAFGNYRLPYFHIDKQNETKIQFVNMQKSKIALNLELDKQLNLIKQLRQTFLREAMQGKLINYTNLTKTGRQLLEQIKEEKTKQIAEKKIKKEKVLPIIKNDEIPFKIPEHWIWCRLGDISKNVTDGEHVTPKKISAGRMLLSAKNIRNGYITYENIDFISEEDYQKSIKRCKPEKNDILIVSVGGTIGRSSIMNDNKEFAIVRSVALIKPLIPIMSKYLKFVLDSPILQKEISGRSWGTAQPCLYINQIKELTIPLPPLQEQERIVSKLDDLMKFCNDLEESISKSQDYNDILLQQVLREALQPKENTKTIINNGKKIENPLKTILAGYIINLNNTTDFGRVKFQKLLFLIEYICKIDFDSNYIKKVAGPYDDALIKSIEADFNRMRFFNVVQEKTDNKRVRYHALAAASELKNLFLENFSDDAVRINNTILKFRPLSWGECELIATLYAVWNNRIIKNEPITDELLYSDFMEWDKQKKKYHSVFYKWLFWMKEERIIPDGWGKYIEKPNAK